MLNLMPLLIPDTSLIFKNHKDYITTPTRNGVWSNRDSASKLITSKCTCNNRFTTLPLVSTRHLVRRTVKPIRAISYFLNKPPCLGLKRTKIKRLGNWLSEKKILPRLIKINLICLLISSHSKMTTQSN